MTLRRILTYVTLVLVSVEIALHMVIAGPVDYLQPSKDPDLLYELEPGNHESTGTLFRIPRYSISVDKLRCRENQIKRTGKQETKRLGEPFGRIVFVGDSFTYGQGVDDRDTFVAQTQTLVTESIGLEVATRNCAVDGYNISQIAKAVEKRAAELKPDLVVVVFFANDLESPLPLHELFPKSAPVTLLTRYSRFVRLTFLLSVMKPWKTKTYLTTNDLREHLSRMASACKSYGSRLISVSIEEPQGPGVNFREEIEGQRIPYYQAPRFMSESTTIPLNGHFNVKGHQKYANWITPILVRELEFATNTSRGYTIKKRSNSTQ